MNELDLLKKNWNKQENYPKISEEKIYAMLHKNSSSAVKWIFIISIIEFAFGIVLNIGMNFTDVHKDTIVLLQSSHIYTFYQIGSGVLWIASIYFMYQFYTQYKKISTTSSVKNLMESIIKTRKTVKKYIVFNLSAGAVFLLVVYSFIIKEMLPKMILDQQKDISTSVYFIAFMAVILITAIIIILFWLLYRLIYGFLLRRLKKNYDELQKIDF